MELYRQNGVLFYKSALLPCPHGFSTRIGGVSPHPHTKELNLAFGRGDDEEIVLTNLERFASAVGVPSASVVSLPQVHGDTVLTVTRADTGEGYSKKTERAADGYCTTDPSVTLGVKTADCVPILLCGLDESGKAVAVAALHAGWRGTVLRIAARGVEALCKNGIAPTHIRAAIGPAIGFCCYEVDEGFRERFVTEFGEDFLENTFRPQKEGKYTADLKEINRRILLEAGLSLEHIDVSPECTACRPALFFSHRYSHGVRGTMLSIIALPPASDAEI